MKNSAVILLSLLSSSAANDSATSASPVAKVIELLDGMASKVKAEEASAAQTMAESKKFCEKRGDDLNYAIKTSTSGKEELESRISKASIRIDTLGNSIEETLGSIESNEADLKAAQDVRSKEQSDFKAEEKGLVGTMATLEKGILVLQKQAVSKSESLLQVQHAPNVLKAVEAMVSASMISSQDGAGLSSLLQKAQTEEEEPYEKKAGGVIEMIEDLYDKAKEELASLRKKEQTAVNNYEMLSQSLSNEIKFAKKEVEKAQADQKDENKSKLDGERDLKGTLETLAKDSFELKDLTQDCRRKAEDYEAEKKDREEEVKAVETAKEALTSKAMGASGQQYGGASFLQVNSNSNIRSSTDLANFEVVHMIRELAHKQHSQELALLAQKIGSVLRSDHSAKGPFDTIIKMIKDMVSSMETSLQEDTDKKAYCDSERSKVADKKDAKQDEVDKLASKMSGISSKSAQLKSEVQDLQKALSELAAASKEMTEIRSQEKAAFNKNKPEMESGLEGVKTALKVLRKYYESSGKRGGATGIIGMLEVCESDFAKSLSDMKIAEKTAATDFEKETKEMQLEKVRKEQDAKYKAQAAQKLDKDLTEVQSDADSIGEEMAAIIEFSNGIEAECTETQASFAEKAAKRQAEIDGLKVALDTLAGEGAGAAGAFIQTKFLRGGKSHLGF
eukprot:TRINITY_DN245_c0_g1_i2.p1 TRINITY_DN245_c0_g1~~TRINITY_DN245_c0_g1_i2.p1  ORF type:complete len:677 (-),score=258.34 TRINITY_DN245_c0_g1_i2:116-2146(-)